jgi:ammonia channel protein AmtB
MMMMMIIIIIIIITTTTMSYNNNDNNDGGNNKISSNLKPIKCINIHYKNENKQTKFICVSMYFIFQNIFASTGLCFLHVQYLTVSVRSSS